MKKKKLALLSIAGMAALAILVGAGTVALFSDSATNGPNEFGAGTLELQTHRHDVPIEGPMFYTDDNDAGWMGTGEWAPRDTHTRAMFIKNVGTLEGKLSNIQAIAQSDKETAEAFAEQAAVTVAVFEAPPGTDFVPSIMKEVNQQMDAAYKAGMSFWLTRGATRTLANLAADVRKEFLDVAFEVDGVWVSVKDVYTGSLEKLMDGADPLNNITIAPDQTLYMGYSVSLLSDFDLKGATFDNNDIQGKEVKFKFVSEFEQTAHQ